MFVIFKPAWILMNTLEDVLDGSVAYRWQIFVSSHTGSGSQY